MIGRGGSALLHELSGCLQFTRGKTCFGRKKWVSAISRQHELSGCLQFIAQFTDAHPQPAHGAWGVEVADLVAGAFIAGDSSGAIEVKHVFRQSDFLPDQFPAGDLHPFHTHQNGEAAKGEYPDKGSPVSGEVEVLPCMN
jgi:hypothetical protein